MRNSTLLLVAGILTLSRPAPGQEVPGDNVLGIYADLEGLSNSLVSEPGVIEVHLLATGVAEDNIAWWTARLDIVGKRPALIIRNIRPQEHRSADLREQMSVEPVAVNGSR